MDCLQNNAFPKAAAALAAAKKENSGDREAYAAAADATRPDRIAAYKKAVAEARAAEG